jgi:hypothetical protein
MSAALQNSLDLDHAAELQAAYARRRAQARADYLAQAAEGAFKAPPEHLPPPRVQAGP